MFADASWPAHGVFLGHLSLPSFLKPGHTFHGNTARGLITPACSASGINDVTIDNMYCIIYDVMEIHTAIIAFQCVTDTHTYNA